MKTKFLFVTGGVISGIGKGITASSLGRLLISRGFSVFPIKVDPYLNEDAGTMNPIQHGEVFVTDDGAETDLDLGHYERMLSIHLDKRSNFTSGSVFRAVLDKERRGDFLGKTIQFVPHITDEIQQRLLSVAETEEPDFLLVEIGGTVGADIEIQPFAEAIRQLALKVGRENCVFIHVVKMDYVFPSDEDKTKPLQNSVRSFLGLGLSPDILVVRAKRPIGEENIKKISLFCSIPKSRIIEAVDTKSIYEIPLALEKNGFAKEVLRSLHINHGRQGKADLALWDERVRAYETAERIVTVALLGKYHAQSDSYISVREALYHAAAFHKAKLHIHSVDSESPHLLQELRNVDAILVPGGYGKRGIEGMIRGIQFARENKVPYFGICLGLQTAVVEFSRNVLNLKKANSIEFDEKTSHPVITILSGQKGITNAGGTQRLGAYRAILQPGTLIKKIYGRSSIFERHRHRFEVNPKYHTRFKRGGLIFGGLSPDKRLVEFIELPKDAHPFFVGTQAHPEFKSSFLYPHPLFSAFVKAALERKKSSGVLN
ncbi:MAG: CTP synthase [Candidatus Colwellbacteria bacterium RIFCSPHIGHO2_12_FULL_44_17]|uniref:CTP synthase n=1 Tax=Candidatus Colwellbacteria bacterium RIFCSPHIGHO2_12_FULL_44_17 TaxID=1797689 RepID=A0A1G1Z423_9BACT|nr:MAG: CTP synthase [Candidatus Colwellbacteria bacterium RIFCSPHIGHO2_12_FULL_44_17]